MGRPKLPTPVKARRGTLRRDRLDPAPAPRPAAEESNGIKGNQTAGIPDFIATANAYMHDVAAGRIVAGSWVRLAVARQYADLERAATDTAFPYVFDPERATEVCQFLERLPHVEGRWQSPTIRLEPWQVFVVSCMFGWRHRDDLARRRFTQCYLETGRKSAKSTIAAGLALFHLLHEDEPGASVIHAASTGAQARITFSIAHRMIRKAAWLREAGLQTWANAITCEANDGSARPVNAKSQTLDGLNPSMILLDESHAQTYSLHDVLRSAQGARRNPMLLAPTTAGFDLLSVGYGLRQTAEKILQNVLVNDELFAIIYTLDEGDAWNDEKVWIKANPSLGVTPTLDWMRSYARTAEQTPGTRGEFLTKCLSQWLHSASSWLSMPAWDRCGDSELSIEAFRKARCWIGADLASRDDLAALAFLFERAGVLYGFCRAYLPELVVAARAREIPEYRLWADAGLLVLTEGDYIDINRIERDIRDACKVYQVQDIVFDSYGSLQIASSLTADNLPARVEGKSAKTFTGPSLELEARITAGKFRHDGNSLLKWAASNAVVSRKTDGSLLPKKATAESPHKIDPLDALLMGIGGWLRQPAERQSVYTTRGVLTL